MVGKVETLLSGREKSVSEWNVVDAKKVKKKKRTRLTDRGLLGYRLRTGAFARATLKRTLGKRQIEDRPLGGGKKSHWKIEGKRTPEGVARLSEKGGVSVQSWRNLQGRCYIAGKSGVHNGEEKSILKVIGRGWENKQKYEKKSTGNIRTCLEIENPGSKKRTKNR